jgi:hypothetical protein
MQPGVRVGRNILNIHQLMGWLQWPDNIGLETYERMVQTDETIAAGLEFVTLAAVSRLGEYVNEDRPDIQEFIRENFETMQGSLSEAVGNMLAALWAGFTVTEIVLREGGGWFWLEALETLEPSSVRLHVVDDGGPRHGQVDKVYQWWGTAWQVEIPGEKVIHFCNRRLGVRAGNPYGTSRLKSVYKWWALKDPMIAAWGLTMQRYGTPFTFIETAGNGNDQILMPDGAVVSRADYLTELIDSMGTGTGMVLSPGEKVTLAQLSRSVGDDFRALQDYCNRVMLRGILVPILLLDNTDVGSYALGQKHFDLFLLGLQHLLLQVTEVLLEQLIRLLIELNFGPQEAWGYFQTAPLEPEDLRIWSDIYANLANTGFVSAEYLPDRNAVRDLFGHDPIEEGTPWPPVSAQPAGMPLMPLPGFSGTQMRQALMAELDLG